MRKSTRLRALLDKKEILVAPAAYDCFSAMIIEKVGFQALFMSGFCLAASRMGMPDLGIEGRTLTVDHSRNIAAAVDIPVLVDAGTGYGDALGVYQTVRELIRAGTAGCLIEDQISPPACPMFGPPKVTGTEEFISKIGAAIEARKNEHDEDFIIVARTDASRTLGLEEVVKRGRAYMKAGADVIFASGAPKEKDPLQEIVEAIGAPFMLLPAFDKGLTVNDYEAAGVKILSGIEGLLAAAKAVKDVYQELKETGFIKERHCYLSAAIPEIASILKMEKWSEIGTKFNAVLH